MHITIKVSVGKNAYSSEGSAETVLQVSDISVQELQNIANLTAQSALSAGIQKIHKRNMEREESAKGNELVPQPSDAF